MNFGTGSGVEKVNHFYRDISVEIGGNELDAKVSDGRRRYIEHRIKGAGDARIDSKVQGVVGIESYIDILRGNLVAEGRDLGRFKNVDFVSKGAVQNNGEAVGILIRGRIYLDKWPPVVVEQVEILLCGPAVEIGSGNQYGKIGIFAHR